MIAVFNSSTSIFAGFVVFSFLGYMAHSQNAKVEDVAGGGPGLVFVIFESDMSLILLIIFPGLVFVILPQAIGATFSPPFVSFLFFFMVNLIKN